MAQETAETQAEIETLRERIEDLRIRETILRSEIREIGGRDTVRDGIRSATTDLDALNEQIRVLQGLAETYAASKADLEALRQRVASEPIREMANREDGSGNTAGKVTAKVIEQGVERLTGTSLAGVGAIATLVVDYGGRWVIRNWNAAEIEDLVRSQRLPLLNLLRDINTLQQQRNAERRRIELLEEKGQEFREILAELAPAQQRLDVLTGNAKDEANLRGETDPAGNAKVESQTRGAGVRLCDPSQKPKPFGVRPAGSKSAAGAAKVPVKEDKGPVAQGAACRDITGFWTFNSSTMVFGKAIPLPALRAEITPAETGGQNAYEVFAQSKLASAEAPIMRCSLTGHELNCQRRVQPQKCPPSQYIWTDMKMIVAEDVSAITGEFAQVHTFAAGDPSGCTMERFDGQATITYRFEPVAIVQAEQ